MPEKSQNITIAAIVIAFLLVPIGYFILNSNKSADKPAESPKKEAESVVKNDVPDLDNKVADVIPDPQVEDNTDMPQNKVMTTDQKLKVQKPEMTIDVKKKYTALMKTSEGDIKLQLNAAATPITVNNFVYLSKLGFYNDVIFHRVIKNFMIQSGDPLGTGAGGPAYKFDDEKFSGKYSRGTIAMANAGPNTNGSQFFIMHKDYPLPPAYVIFGSVVEGFDVVDKIAEADVLPSGMGEVSKPVNPVKIISVEVTEE